MPDPKKRIVVDGVEFGSLFQFPRILRSITSAMQPPRLVIALLMVVAIVAVGRTWDGLTEPRVSPAGLLAGPVMGEETEAMQGLLRAALTEYDLDVPPAERMLSAGRVLTQVESSYRAQRSRRVAAAAGADDVDAEPLESADEQFLAVRASIDATAPQGVYAATSAHVTDCSHRVVKGVIYLRPQMIFEAGTDLFVRLPVALWQQERWFTIIFGLFALVILAVGGGAISRMAACEFAGQERLRVREAIDFATGNWLTLVLTPLLPLLIAGGLAVVLLGVGLLFLPWVDLLGSILYGAGMILASILAFLLIGYAIGFPLLLPAVAVENCDAADAQQRAYAYVLSRPLHIVGYGAVALVGLALGYVVVALVATTMLNTCAALVSTFTDNSALASAGGFGIFNLSPETTVRIHDSWHSETAAGVVSFWQRIVVDLVVAWLVAYVFTAATMIYLLMRRACDGQDIEEIWRPGLMPGTLVPLPRPRVDHAEAVATTAEAASGGSAKEAAEPDSEVES